MILSKCPEPHEKQEKYQTNICFLWPVLVKIDQTKMLRKVFENINSQI